MKQTTKCQFCGRRVWFFQKREEDNHASCTRTARLFDETLKRMQKAGEIPTPAQYRRMQREKN